VKSRVNDVNHTLKAIGNEVSVYLVCQDIGYQILNAFLQLTNLRSRTGVEAMLFLTRGSTDLPMRGIAFSTEGVEEFLETGLKMDTQDFISKLEGFAVRGVQGESANRD
jgi:hypothetical protein